MNNDPKVSDAWYTADGNDTDVVLSTRVRLARNLSGFAFPAAIKTDDAESVLSLVFDAFNHIDNPEQFQMVRMNQVDSIGRRILSERGIIESGTGSEPWRGIVIRNDGILSATVNMEDHVRLASFSPGLAVFECSKGVFAIDSAIQGRLQFSALPGIGYLTSSLSALGSGMKTSILMCLPALCMNGLVDRVIREYLSQGFVVQGYYGGEGSVSLGYLYQVSNGYAAGGDENLQITRMEQAAAKLVELERKSRQELAVSAKTTLEDTVFRALVTAKYARFINLKEAIELIHRIKLGLNLALVTGIGHKDLTALLYRVQAAHISFVISGGSVIIETDVQNEDLRMDRLRAMVIQEVLKEADIQERR